MRKAMKMMMTEKNPSRIDNLKKDPFIDASHASNLGQSLIVFQ